MKFNDNALIEGIDRLIDLFGEKAQMHFNTFMEPTLVEVLSVDSFWRFEYAILLLLIAVITFMVYRSADMVGRMFRMAFSFSTMYRQLNYVNQLITTASERIAGYVLVVLPLSIIAYEKTINPTLLHNGDYSLITKVIGFSLFVAVYDSIVKFLFRRLGRSVFYRKLFLAEKICLSVYVLIIFPLLLVALVSSPHQEMIYYVQFLITILCYIHLLFINLKLFLEEKVSYVQLILYFCTVKAALIGFTIYFVFYFI